MNLRKPKNADDTSEVAESDTSSFVAFSEPIISTQILEEPEDNIITPPHSPSQRVRFRTSSIDLGDSPRKLRLPTTPNRPSVSSRTVPEQAIVTTPTLEPSAPIFNREHRPSFSRNTFTPTAYVDEKAPITYQPAPVIADDRIATGSILEQAWVLKMASEIARRAHDEKASREGVWSQPSRDEREDSPPPAYEAKTL